MLSLRLVNDVIDKYGVGGTLRLLAQNCEDRADVMRENPRGDMSERAWRYSAKLLRVIADRVERRRPDRDAESN